MGEMADYELERQESLHLRQESKALMNWYGQSDKPTKVYWITKNGEKLEIKDMTTSHIEYSITKCRRDNWRLEAIPYLEEELRRRK